MSRISLNRTFSEANYRAAMDSIESAVNALSPTSSANYYDDIIASQVDLMVKVYEQHNYTHEQLYGMYVDVFADDTGISYMLSTGIQYRGSPYYDVTRGGSYVIDTQDEYQDGEFFRTTIGGSSSAPETTIQTNNLYGYWTSPEYDCLGVNAYTLIEYTKSTQSHSVFSNEADTVALYRFNDTSGTTVTDVTNNHNGTASVDTIWNVGGKFSGCALFTGTEYIEVDDNDELTPNNITIEFWAKPTTTEFNDYGVILSKHENAGQGSYAVYFRDGKFNFYTSTDGTATVLSIGSPIITDTNWYYVACTYDGSNNKIYVNGELQHTDAQTGNIFNSTGKLQIGRQYYGGSGSIYYQGYLDELRISSTAHTASQIKNVYHQTKVKYITRSGTSAVVDSTWQDWLPVKTIIDSCDSISNWNSSDPTNVVLSLDTTVKEEGTGCIKVAVAGVDTLGDTIYRKNYASVDISGKEYLHLKIRASQTGTRMRMYLKNELPVEIVDDFDCYPIGNWTISNGWITDGTGDEVYIYNQFLCVKNNKYVSKSFSHTPAGSMDWWFYGEANVGDFAIKLYEDATVLNGVSDLINRCNLASMLVTFGGGNTQTGTLAPVHVRIAWTATNIWEVFVNGVSIGSENFTNAQTDGCNAISFTHYTSPAKYAYLGYIGMKLPECNISGGVPTFRKRHLDINVTTADAWEDVYFDLTDIPANERNSIKGIVFQVLDGSSAFDFYIDDITVHDGYATLATIGSMPARYLQSRALLTSTEPTITPALLNTTMNYTLTGSSYVVTNAITTSYVPQRLYIHAEETLNSGTITYYGSRDNGTTWTLMANNAWTWIGGPVGTTVVIKAVIGVDAELDALGIAWGK